MQISARHRLHSICNRSTPISHTVLLLDDDADGDDDDDTDDNAHDNKYKLDLCYI